MISGQRNYSMRIVRPVPRMPLDGELDLTYRCNNNCRHCWLWLPANAPEQKDELTFDEIRGVVDDARAMGCRNWAISGGEPLLRPDFPEIFDYITRKSASYTLNTNGTLITPDIAHLLKRKGVKMIALYGATAETYDRVARQPGGFELAMRGFSAMRDAGAGFIVQVIPIRDNWHEWQQMQALAASLSPHWRIGASWLCRSASGDTARNAEIERQRLDPRDVVTLAPPETPEKGSRERGCGQIADDDRLLASCIEGGRTFHIDPYGGMTFCGYIKDPTMRYDLRKGTFSDAWDVFIPSLVDKVRGETKYRANCGRCDLTDECSWCPVYGYLECRDFSAKVDSLCAIARETDAFKKEWLVSHRRYYRVAGITIQMDSELPITDMTFGGKFDLFRVDGPGEDTVKVQLHFKMPDLQGQDLGKEVYRKAPWAIHRQGSGWLYLSISPQIENPAVYQVVTFNHDYTNAHVYNDGDDRYLAGGLDSLTMMPSDLILTARLLADRQAFCLHSAGAIINGAGVLFVGHSEAGKSTMTRLLMDACAKSSGDQSLTVEILCDDRNIVRRSKYGWRVYGTWSHGDVPVVSPSSAPLCAICFIEKSEENTLTLLIDRREITRRLLSCIIRPLLTADWWHKTVDEIERISQETPCYVLRFDKSGRIVEKLIRMPSGAANLAKAANGEISVRENV